MNVVFFGLKRAHHGVLRVLRGPLGDLGLTPARFDMLYAVRERGRAGILQSALRRVLGVSAPTVSRMLVSLESLGLIQRSRTDYADRRQRRVILTNEGKDTIGQAIWQFMRTGLAQLVLDSALAEKWFDEDACFFAIERFDSELARLRLAFRDSATLYYPWHPDD